MPEAANTLRLILEANLERLPLSDSGRLVEPLLAYLQLLERWNKAYNLTSVRDPEQMIVRHVMDSLAIAGSLEPGERRFIDVGTGAGLPGVPLALLYPDREFDLLDSNGKKTRFLFQVKTELGLANMTVHHHRAEKFEPIQRYDVVLSRAFSALGEMLDCCAHLVTDEGRFLAMKGLYPGDELALAGPRCESVEVERIVVPGLDEERHLVSLKIHHKSIGENLG